MAGGPVQHLPDGHPDMQVWNASNNGGAVFELQNHPTGRRPYFGSGKGAIVDPVDGFIPYQPWAAAKAKDTFENHLAEEPELHCYESGVPKQMYVQFGFQIVSNLPAGQLRGADLGIHARLSHHSHRRASPYPGLY